MRDGTYLRHLDDPSWQLENLILQPIKDLRVVGPLVIVIDALDESGDEHARRGMLALLTAKISEFPSYFRILMTSRPEPDIVTIFQSFGGSTHLIYMDDSTLAAETTQDILGYIRFQRDGSNAQFRKFLNEDRCRKLRDRSEGLFQWASVACSYLTGSVGGLTIADLFDNIVKQSTDAASLDTLYTQVLRQHFNMSSARVNKRFKSVMGYVLAAFEPLSISSLAEMQTPGDDDTTDPHETVNAVVGHMGALLSGIHDHSSPIRPLHTSFRDFLVDIQRSSYFYVNPETYHSNLASACLRILNTHLKFNMAGLETSYSLNENIPNLEARTRRCLPSHVAYACRFWATHLQHSTFDEGICDQVRCFLFEKLLFWLEALSLLREVSTAASGLTYAIQWTEGHNSVEDLQEMARDAVNFVRQFGTCIAQSTPHLYLSALPFSPETSHIIKHYGSRFRRIPRVGKGRAAVWPACEMVLTPHCSSINAVTFSPDGHRIAFGCDDGTVGLVSAETGEAIGGYLQGHKARVLSVAFSPNGRHIISGSDDTTVRIWCAETHEVIGILKGHTRSIMSVAFSPDGRHIVSGSRDMTIRLWTTHMGEAIGVPLKDHKAEVLSVAFSPDGRRIISGSTDATVRLWDVVTGETVMIISCKSSDFYGALSVAFSLDRSRCVVSDAGLYEHDVGMWSLETGKAIGSPLMLDDRHPVSVAFSPDGLLVVVGSENCNVRLWDPKMRESWMMHPRWKGHMGAVTSVAFSPDGRRIVSGSRDQTIRLWKTNFGKIMPMQDHWHRPGQRDFRLIVSIAFSPDGRYIASGSVRGGNNTMDLWSTQTGDAIGAPQKVFRGVRSLAFSPDGSHIVFVSDYHYDCTVRLWCIDTGNLVICSPPVENCRFFKSVAFSQDGGHVILTFHQNICMWNTETME
ncbi:WD40-repeat-containing domain protein, partial [Amylostereum chailletii]